MARLGTLNWQVSKMAFDAMKVLVLFYIKNLVMALVHPSRYGQLHTALVEQRVPVRAEAAAAPARVVVVVVAAAGLNSAGGAAAR